MHIDVYLLLPLVVLYSDNAFSFISNSVREGLNCFSKSSANDLPAPYIRP